MIDLELIDDEERRPKSLVYTTTLLYDPIETSLAGEGSCRRSDQFRCYRPYILDERSTQAPRLQH